MVSMGVMAVVAASERTGLVEQPGQFSGVLDWFARMRDTDPVSWDERYGAWHVFQYADVAGILADPATYSSDLSGLIPAQEEIDLFTKGNFVRMDPPRHDKLRKLVSKAFTPRVVAELEPRITAITNELLDEVVGSPQFDLVEALAYPLPVTVIAELIGVPVADRERFRRWADSLLSAQLPDTMVPKAAVLQAQGARMREMLDYLLAHIRQRRASPTNDLTSTLIAAEIDGERLEDEEIVGFVGVLLIAGHITTTTLLTNTILCLDEHPDAARRLRADPTRLPPALEEVLRYRAPFPRLARLAMADSTIGGRKVPAGQLLNLWLASANRDKRQFEDPDRFDIARAPNPHLSFGHGIHFCIGAPLARLEGRVAMTMLLERCRDLKVGEDVEMYDARIMTGAKRLPLHAVWADATGTPDS
jgi:cytochrome P450